MGVEGQEARLKGCTPLLPPVLLEQRREKKKGDAGLLFLLSYVQPSGSNSFHFCGLPPDLHKDDRHRVSGLSVPGSPAPVQPLEGQVFSFIYLGSEPAQSRCSVNVTLRGGGCPQDMGCASMWGLAQPGGPVAKVMKVWSQLTQPPAGATHLAPTKACLVLLAAHTTPASSSCFLPPLRGSLYW